MRELITKSVQKVAGVHKLDFGCVGLSLGGGGYVQSERNTA